MRDFYERTRRWRLDVWTAWSPWAWPFGGLVSTFAQRLEQLALPMRPLDVAHGMTSTVVPLWRDGHQAAALRRLRSSGAVVFSGLYSTVPQQGTDRVLVRVIFPLPNGRLMVLLAPAVGPDVDLLLTSGPGGWGQPGAYLVVDRSAGCCARRTPVHEWYRVHLDDEQVLRTDHRLALGAATALRLHYRLSLA